MEKKSSKVRYLGLADLKQHLIRNGSGSKHHKHCLSLLCRKACPNPSDTKEQQIAVKEAAKLLAEYRAQGSENCGSVVTPSW
jgi:hypothetical protein